MFYYAQINDDNVCFAVSQLSGEVILDKMILLTEYNVSLIGKKYNNGAWEDVPTPEPQEPSLTEMEQTVLETSLNVEYLMCLAELNN